MKTEAERHEQLVNLGFVIDENHTFKIYNHECGIWIADYALVQYSSKEWDAFLNEVNESLN